MDGLLRSLEEEIIPGSNMVDPYSELTMQMLKIKAVAEAVRDRHCPNGAIEEKSRGSMSHSGPNGIAISDIYSESNLSSSSSLSENSEYKCSTITFKKEEEKNQYDTSDGAKTSIFSSTEECKTSLEKTDFGSSLSKILHLDSENTQHQVKSTETKLDEDLSNEKSYSTQKQLIFFEKWFSGKETTSDCNKHSGEEIMRVLQCEENPVCDWVEL